MTDPQFRVVIKPDRNFDGTSSFNFTCFDGLLRSFPTGGITVHFTPGTPCCLSPDCSKTNGATAALPNDRRCWMLPSCAVNDPPQAVSQTVSLPYNPGPTVIELGALDPDTAFANVHAAIETLPLSGRESCFFVSALFGVVFS